MTFSKNFQNICPVCGKGKGHAFKAINHSKCAIVLKEQNESKHKKPTTKRITNQIIEYFVRTGNE